MITRKQIDRAVIALFKLGGRVPTRVDLEKYAECFSRFAEAWTSARAALRDDWRYAESLHAAGLLCRIEWPRLDKKGDLVKVDTVYCRDPGTME